MATTTRSTLVAVFRNRTDAESAANDLKANGFSGDEVYVGSYKDSGGSGPSREWHATHHHEGGIKGWFKSLFGDEHETEDYRAYEGAANRGGVIVSVQADDQELDRATKILQTHNPIDINEEGSTSAAGQRTGARTQQPQATAGEPAATMRDSGSGKNTSPDLPASIPVVEEDLRVGKRSVVRGGVRVYSRVVEQPVEETVNLREERVRVDRQPVNRAANAGDLRPGTDQVIEVQEYAEEAVIEKQARVVEEVRVSKDVSERSQTVRDTVRRSEVQVEDLSRAGDQRDYRGQGDYNDDFRRDFETRYAGSGGSYEDYAPAYTYGYQAANDPRFQGRNWDEVESDLRTGYGNQYPNSTWDKVKDSIRYGWDKVTGKARSATTHGD
jgi:uncharacterized protein (TIGR02271 family)